MQLVNCFFEFFLLLFFGVLIIYEFALLVSYSTISNFAFANIFFLISKYFFTISEFRSITVFFISLRAFLLLLI